MNYCRIMELPLTLELLDLDLSKKQTILDISSPKLLAFYLAINGYDILATNLEDYFVNDFDVFAQKFNLPTYPDIVQNNILLLFVIFKF